MRSSLAFFFLCLTCSIDAQFTIIVDQVPDGTPAQDDIYIAGDFQGWDPASPNHILTRDTGTMIYHITLETDLGTIQFKFTRGSWLTVEADSNGNFRPNRSYDVVEGDTIVLQILGWEDLDRSCRVNPPLSSASTAADNVEIFSDTFAMPQFERCRRIWVYVPPDYHESNRRYPVMYMHDGQNVFDASTSFAGEWRVDETMNQLFEGGDSGIIVVAIDNGQVFRAEEYIPWPFPGLSTARGHLYADFIVNTLKPVIDMVYRTKPDRENTAIMGSSFGGVISMYTGLEFQEVFSKIGSFSPSYWVSEQAYQQVQTTGKRQDMRIYQIMGTPEGQDAVRNMLQMEEELHAAGFGGAEVLSVVHPDGAHNEGYWAREFAAAYLWLFDQSTTATGAAVLEPSVYTIYPNPSAGIFEIKAGHYHGTLMVIDQLGRVVHRESLKKSIDLAHLKGGLYLVKIVDPTGNQFSKNIVLIR